jgi:hypothetical protein
MPITKARVDWSPEQIAELTRLYHEGQTLLDISLVCMCSESSVKVAVNRFGLNEGASYVRRMEGVVRRLWRYRQPGRIAQAFRFPVDEVIAIAKRLDLGPEATAHVPTKRHRHVFTPARLTWACRNRHACPEASLVWDMIRNSKGLPPIGKGYRA